MKKIAAVVFLMAAAAVFSFAGDMYVSYADGDVTVKEDGQWYDLFAGDELDQSSVIKLGEDTVAEIQADGRKIILDRPGVYKMSGVMEKVSKETSSWGNSSVIKKFITGTNKAASKTAVMGVRGAEADTNDVEWLTEDNMVLTDAKTMIEKGEYKKAISLLSDNIGDAFDEEMSEYDFYLGKCYYLTGEPGKALSYLNKVDADPSAEYYPDFVIVKGNLLLDSFNYKKALNLFDDYLKIDDVSETAQAVTFFSARALDATGKKADAKTMLEKTVRMNPDSEIGSAAAKLLKNF